MAISRPPQLTPSPCAQAWSEALGTFVLAAKEVPKRQRAHADASRGTAAAAAAAGPSFSKLTQKGRFTEPRLNHAHARTTQSLNTGPLGPGKNS